MLSYNNFHWQSNTSILFLKDSRCINPFSFIINFLNKPLFLSFEWVFVRIVQGLSKHPRPSNDGHRNPRSPWLVFGLVYDQVHLLLKLPQSSYVLPEPIFGAFIYTFHLLDPRTKWGSIEMYLDQSLLNHVCLFPIQATGCLTISMFLRISVLFRLFLWGTFVSPLGLVLALFLFYYQPAFLRSW